ncbi:MAG: sugar phosphate isomerase/epimerase [Clostridia bacterium]|nr:sugar phosphate isomerase/epimerase [Clostridia bacterium]
MRIGAQLYTVRDFCRNLEDFEETLKKIADIGYEYVQVSGTCAYEANWLAEKLAANGLACALTHYNGERIRTETAKVIDEHKIFGCRLIGVGSLPGGFDAPDAFDRFIREYREPAGMIAEKGLYFMYHNHQFEFAKDKSGLRGIEKMAESFSPSEMGFTLDAYWIQFAGADPALWIRNLSGRVPAIHLKDMAIEGGTQKMAVVGEGNINFGRVLYEAENAGTEYLLVEQDNCNGEDPFECLRRSRKQLNSWGLN